MERITALIVAAGRGSRMGESTPKQYLTIAGKPVLRHTIDAFLSHPRIKKLYVVIHPDDKALYEQAVEGLDLPTPIIGGAERYDSVFNGLNLLADKAPQAVLIHDAARPCVSHDVIDRVVAGLEASPAVIPALVVSDTLKYSQNNRVERTVDRQNLYRAQTPQGFHFSAIYSAYLLAKEAFFTDDASVCEHAAIPVTVVAGEERNLKITTKDDMQRAESLIAVQKLPDIRTGMGFDVHRFCSPKAVTDNTIAICGIHVPHERSLEAHSDGDVGLHSLVDAMLGAIGAGDIGQHFPPTDPQWKDADSAAFVRHAASLVAQAGGHVNNVDITIIGERPKVGPHREAMRKRIASLLSLGLDRVNVKATTTEQLGFTGRKEGLAAQAVVSIIVQ